MSKAECQLLSPAGAHENAIARDWRRLDSICARLERCDYRFARKKSAT